MSKPCPLTRLGAVKLALSLFAGDDIEKFAFVEVETNWRTDYDEFYFKTHIPAKIICRFKKR